MPFAVQPPLGYFEAAYAIVLFRVFEDFKRRAESELGEEDKDF